MPPEYFSKRLPKEIPLNFLFNGDCEKFLDQAISQQEKMDLVFTSPPYNLSKGYTQYGDDRELQDYLEWQERVITKCVALLPDSGSICWQVGNYVSNGHIVPLDLELSPVFKKLGLKLRNRIVWSFGHGLHCKRRFSGRYEVVLWYSKSDNYTFNLDAVRVPSKYPQKKHFKGPKKGQLSGNPLGKNPSDVWADDLGDFWQIPNVKHNHIEKTQHPCQFPVGLVQRFIEALTNEHDKVFDPFLGVGTTAATSALLNRRFFGCELDPSYFEAAKERVELAASGWLAYRDPNLPIYQPPTPRLQPK